MPEPGDPRVFVHCIDGEDRIRSVNDAWLDFAAENDWEVSASRVLGTALSGHIADPETRHVYRLLLDRVRREGRRVRFRFRCDSPGCRRFMEMRIGYRDDLEQVEFRSRLLRLERRVPVALFDPRLERLPGECLRVCSWCKSVAVDDDWLEVERAVARLGLLQAGRLPGISHGICPACSDQMTNAGARP